MASSRFGGGSSAATPVLVLWGLPPFCRHVGGFLGPDNYPEALFVPLPSQSGALNCDLYYSTQTLLELRLQCYGAQNDLSHTHFDHLRISFQLHRRSVTQGSGRNSLRNSASS